MDNFNEVQTYTNYFSKIYFNISLQPATTASHMAYPLEVFQLKLGMPLSLLMHAAFSAHHILTELHP
jgi:hypothetical protein